MFLWSWETFPNAAKVFILVLLIFTTDSLEAARHLNEMKSTPAATSQVSFTQDRGRVPPSAPNQGVSFPQDRGRVPPSAPNQGVISTRSWAAGYHLLP
ncbi:hypothetical protein SLA2020_267820 [Shorea laevis]